MSGGGQRAFVLGAGLLAALTPFDGTARAQAPPAASVGSLALTPQMGRAQHALPPPPPARQEPQDVAVRTDLDRMAMWVADRLTYTVEITCNHGMDIVVDDLARDKLGLDGLVVVDDSVSHSTDGHDVTRYQFRYILTTYRIDLPTLTIAPMAVRYYVKRSGQRAQDTTPAGTIQVPGAMVAFRSLLPDHQPYPVRDGRPAATRPLIYRSLEPVGLGLMLLSAAPVGLAAIALARRVQRRRQGAAGRSPQEVRQDSRGLLARVRAVDPTTAEIRQEGFRQLDALVRQHVSGTCGVRAANLTPPEIAAALRPGSTQMPVALLTSILSTCELARYAPDGLPSADAWRETLAQAEQVLATGR